MSTTSPEATWPGTAPTARRRSIDLVGRARAGAPLGALLLLTALVYLWALSRNGFANQYYAAAVQAGTHSWKAFLFGSLDASNYITVDKPPASLWVMELFTRAFGFSSFSMLLPQALEGLAAVALLYATVRRWFGQPAALLSGLILALTPVAALMFRFNNPDALLVLLLVLAAYALTRALERGATRWLVLAGAAIGFAFLAKMMQAFLVLPAFATVYLVAAPVPLRRRLWQVALAGLVMVACAGWWIALVELWPAASRPYVGGSSDNSILQLVLGYNGLERISSGGLSGPGGAFSGAAGVLRLFNAQMGGQISWLLPASVISLIAGMGWTARRPRTDRLRSAVLLWGGWLVLTALLYSFMTGVIHPYYTNTLAPPIAVLVGVGATQLWHHRRRLSARLILAAMIASTALWSFALLDRTPEWHPWLRYAVIAAGLLSAAAVALAGARLGRRALAAIAATAVIASLAGPVAYTLSAVGSPQTGSTPAAGPASSRSGFSFGGGAGARISSTLARQLESSSSPYRWVAATSSAQSASSIELSTGSAVMALGGFSGSDNSTTLARFEQLVARGEIHYYVAGGGFGGGMGHMPSGASLRGAGSFRPPAGGAGGGPAGGRSQGVSSQIETWVTKHFKKLTVGGTTVYDLTQRAA